MPVQLLRGRLNHLDIFLLFWYYFCITLTPTILINFELLNIMPNRPQAKKALRKSAKRAERNLMIKQDLKTLIKKTKQAIEAKDAKVGEMLKQVQKSIDKAVQKGVIKKNTGSRKLSRIMALQKRVNQPVKKEEVKEKPKK